MASTRDAVIDGSGHLHALLAKLSPFLPAGTAAGVGCRVRI